MGYSPNPYPRHGDRRAYPRVPRAVCVEGGRPVVAYANYDVIEVVREDGRMDGGAGGGAVLFTEERRPDDPAGPLMMEVALAPGGRLVRLLGTGITATSVRAEALGSGELLLATPVSDVNFLLAHPHAPLVLYFAPDDRLRVHDLERGPLLRRRTRVDLDAVDFGSAPGCFVAAGCGGLLLVVHPGGRLVERMVAGPIWEDPELDARFRPRDASGELVPRAPDALPGAIEDVTWVPTTKAGRPAVYVSRDESAELRDAETLAMRPFPVARPAHFWTRDRAEAHLLLAHPDGDASLVHLATEAVRVLEDVWVAAFDPDRPRLYAVGRGGGRWIEL